MWKRALIFLASAAVTCTFFINFCATVFQCGCTWLWAGAEAHCNIHSSGAHHCPWCAHSPYPALAAMLASQLAISFWPAAWSNAVRLIAALAAFPATGGFAAAIYGLGTGYWK